MNINKPDPNLRILSRIELNYSATQWALKCDQFPRLIIEKIADYLNKRVSMGYNRGLGSKELQTNYDGLRKEFALYITKQTDQVFESIVEKIYKL